VYWEQPPTDAERRVVIEQAGAVVAAFDAYDSAAQQGRDVYFVYGDAAGGILFDVTHQPVAAMEQLLADVLERHDATYIKQREIAGMQHNCVLHGAGLVEGWRRRAATYPDQLALATVRRFLTFGPHWMIEQAAARHDALFLRNLCWEAIYRVLPVLMALNRIYYPSHKHLHRLLAGLAIAPPELWPRVLAVLRADERDSADTLRALIADTFTLVETHLPAFDTTEARRRWQLPATAAVGGEKLRRAVLRRVVTAYRATRDVRALLLTGSVALGSADQYSDLDLIIEPV